MPVLFIVYATLGYWAAGVVVYENKIVFHQLGGLFLQKLGLGIIFGWILIPIAILKRIFIRK